MDALFGLPGTYIYRKIAVCDEFEASGNINGSARNINADASGGQHSDSSGSQRPNSAPSGTRAVSGCLSDTCRNPKFQSPSLPRLYSNDKYFGGNTYGIQSSGSLTRTPSIETPLGVVRLSSSSRFEAHVPSSSSNESFRRDISLYKLNAMPVLEEDDNSPDNGADEIGGQCKTKDRSKLKKNRRHRPDPEMIEIHLETEENDEEHEREAEMSQDSKGKRKSLSTCFRGLFPCIKPNKNDLDPDNLLDMPSTPQEK